MEKAQLILEINDTRMSAYRLENDHLQELVTLSCSNRTDAGYRQTLQELVEACGNTDAFDSYSCSYSTPKCTLVPMSLFGEAKPEALLALTVNGTVPKGETDYNRLPEWNIVNIYHMPLWVKSVLITKIPRIVIQHEWTHLLRFLNTGSAIPLRTHIILQESHFCCIIRKDGQLVHASYQDYQAAEDVLYHLLYCFQALGIETKGEVFIQTGTEALREKGTRLKTLSEQLQPLRQQAVSVLFQQHLLFQTLCV